MEMIAISMKRNIKRTTPIIFIAFIKMSFVYFLVYFLGYFMDNLRYLHLSKEFNASMWLSAKLHKSNFSTKWDAVHTIIKIVSLPIVKI